MPNYCHSCEENRKARTDGRHLYCAVCGAEIGIADEE